ncbi:MAG: tetratricopeptide repeat protein [Bacteroidota bacterium]|nr:tetratricopeptide repeat protein [Bacteroidota bacterium]
MNRLKGFLVVAGFILFTSSFAQKTRIYTHEDRDFSTAIELYQKEKYAAAQNSFSKVIATHSDPMSLIRIDAEYYRAVCAIELFNKDGEMYLKQFVAEHPESPKVKFAYYNLGKYNYRKKKYRDAIEWFQKVDIYDLTTEELAEFYFKRGYSYFSTEKYAEAKKDLYEIKDVDNKYASAAKYYYAHIAYNEKNYETALADFMKLQTNETFGPVVPYYIAQIYYLQGKYDKVIEYAPALLDSASTKRMPEIARVLGESYYRTSRYKEAIPYLLKYEKATNSSSRKDNYQLGYAYYKVNDCENALNYLIKVTNYDDSLVQNAYYHMADCYLKMDNKPNARNAFGQASKLDFDKVIQEDALYNYAKLCYELAFNPYNEAIKAFQKYIKTYPESPRLDEAYTYLVNVFTTTKNYKEAIEAIESIKTLTPELKQAHQKVAYFRGVELFNNKDYAEAIKLFDKAVTYKFDKNISASAVYWKGEAYFRMEKYAEAIENYIDYTAEPGSISKSELSDVNYNVGYAYYKLKDYPNSLLWFRKFVTFKPQADAKKVNDAYNRIGDGYFMNRDYAAAVDYYGQAYSMKLINADYALFQRALAYGVMKKYSEKINDLKTFINNYSSTSSTYLPKAKFELAQTYYLNNQNDLALSGFKKFIEEYPNSLYVNASLSKIGLIYYNKKDDENALAYFDKLIKRDRKSAEANEAVAIIKDIYTSKGDVPGLTAYLSSIGASLPKGALDSLAFDIGKKHYLKQDCKNVVTAFDNYSKQFPDGIFITEASFYKAECEYRAGNTDAALISYGVVISKNKNQFTEVSLAKASDIAYKKQNCNLALDYFRQLEQVAEDPKNNASAKTGLMRCNYQLKNMKEAVDYANKVLTLEGVSNELSGEAHFIIAHSHFAAERYEDAMAEFKVVTNKLKSEIAAEAAYYIAEIQFKKGEFKNSQKTIFSLINGEGDFPYWIDKALILLADNYVGLKDNFQAKTTYRSVIDDSHIPELIKLAQQKLADLIAAEEAEKKMKTPQEPLKVGFDENGTNQDKLFTEPVKSPEEGEPKNE